MSERQAKSPPLANTRTVGDQKTGEQRKDEFKCKVRLATFGDLEAIMDINDDVFNGVDYMPAMFHHFLHSKIYRLYVIEEDDKLVCVGNFKFHSDEEDLVVAMSGRVRDGYQGRGYGPSIKNPIVAQLLKEFPKLTRYIASAIFEQRIKDNITRWKVASIDNFLMYKIFDRPRFKSFLGRTSVYKYHSLPDSISYTAGIEWINNSDQLLRFISKFSDYIGFTIAWIPYRVNSDTVRQLMQNMIMFATFAEPSDSSSATEVSGVSGEGRELTGFSYSSGLQCKFGYCVDIHFFGDDQNLFIGHILRQLKHYDNIVKDNVNISFHLHFPKTLSVIEVEESLREGFGNAETTGDYTANQTVQYFVDFFQPNSKL